MLDKPVTNELKIREMTYEDPPIIAEAYRAQDWDKSQKLLEGYYREQAAGTRTVLVAELDGTFVIRVPLSLKPNSPTVSGMSRLSG